MAMSFASIVRAAVGAPLLLVLGCGGPLKYAPKPTAKAPEADVKISADVHKDQGSTKLVINIEHLATPDRLADGGAHYVVWYRKNSDQAWQRVGALKYDDGSRKGVAEDMTVPETAFELEVTDEHDTSPGSPSPNVIVSQLVGN
jgi:hypothetical protein